MGVFLMRSQDAADAVSDDRVASSVAARHGSICPARTQAPRSRPMWSMTALAGVLGRSHGLKFRTCEPFPQRGIVTLVAQLQAQRVHKGNRSVDHAHTHVRFTTCRVNGLWNLDEALALAGQGAGAVHDLPPQLARLPKAVVGRRIAEAQKNGQRQAHQRERYRRESDLDAEQIAVRDRDKGRKQDIE